MKKATIRTDGTPEDEAAEDTGAAPTEMGAEKPTEADVTEG